MHVDSNMLTYTMPPEQRGFYELSCAIVKTAVEDYRVYRKAWHMDKEAKRAQWQLDQLRTFFMSDMFEKISGFENHNVFLMQLDEQIDQEYENNVKRKRHKSKIQFK